MEKPFEIISFIFSLVIMLYLAYRTFQLFISNDKLTEFITKHYSDKGLEVSSISRLGTTEKIKYGVPISIFWIYSYYFGFLTGKISYVRKVEIEKDNDSLLLKYVEIQISKKEIIYFKEFDSYEIDRKSVV